MAKDTIESRLTLVAEMLQHAVSEITDVLADIEQEITITEDTGVEDERSHDQ
jgi:hypothetical protein